MWANSNLENTSAFSTEKNLAVFKLNIIMNRSITFKCVKDFEKGSSLNSIRIIYNTRGNKISYLL